MATEPRRVALLIETSTSWGTALIRGISRYAKSHGPWLFFLEPRGRLEPARLPRGWRGDGVLARVNNPELDAELRALGVPTVDVSWFNYSNGFAAKCTVSARGIARLAVEHFLERGLRNIGYCEPTGRPEHTDPIGGEVRLQAERVGASFSVHGRLDETGQERSWNEALDACARWLMSLERPAGVLAFSDVGGRHVAEACSVAGLSVPGDIAILGSEQDELSAMVSTPPLSSIDVGAERVGYAAAEILDRMMRGEPAPPKAAYYDPLGVIARQSTEIIAVDDPVVARACRIIAQRYQSAFGVEDILDEMSVSRRMLENRFSRVIGRTPGAVIRRKRLEHAARMLLDEERVTIAEVAESSGFGSPESLSRAFREEYGCPPSQFRRVEQRIGDT